MGDMRSVNKRLVGKPEGKSPLGRPRHRYEDNIRINLKRNRLGGCGLDSSTSG
jgi:hypothetical protein